MPGCEPLTVRKLGESVQKLANLCVLGLTKYTVRHQTCVGCVPPGLIPFVSAQRREQSLPSASNAAPSAARPRPWNDGGPARRRISAGRERSTCNAPTEPLAETVFPAWPDGADAPLAALAMLIVRTHNATANFIGLT